MLTKKEVHQQALTFVIEKKDQLKKEWASIQEAANLETKSSAGDKYETARAMAQIEIDRLRQQVVRMEFFENTLRQLSTDPSDRALPGALILTDTSRIYWSVPLGKINLGDTHYFLLSADAPLAKALQGRGKGDKVEFLGTTHTILEVL